MSLDEMERRAQEAALRDPETKISTYYGDERPDRNAIREGCVYDIERRLRDLVNEEPLNSRMRGLLGNILGEVKALHRNDSGAVWAATQDVREIIEEYKTDPVIKTYLDQKKGWTEKLNIMRTSVREALSAVGDDYDD